MKKDILLLFFLGISILVVGCGNSNKKEAKLISNTEIIKTEKKI